jgi:deoxycytidylate deaminase
MYVTHLPCEDCAKYIAAHNDHTNFKITRLVYGKRYPENIPDVVVGQRYIIMMEGGIPRIEQYQL